MIPRVDGKLRFGFPQRTTTFCVCSVRTSPTWVINPCGINLYLVPSTWCQVTVEFIPRPTSDTGTIGPYHIGIAGSDASTAFTSNNAARAEMSDSISRLIGREDGTQVLKWQYCPEDTLGAPVDDDVASAVVSANPTQTYFAHVWWADQTAPTTSNMDIRIAVKYNVEYYQLKQ
ncbi:hypothetical protein L914_06010 [Phytophthora nicotianae]|uniref:Uncharacterized protein n=3 Tax=Phytophthora nicotianae TaxID=4792 RepID=V9FFH0_PHYNI|nr:hypothetical protein F443_06190 [Phytophthora nicotianae P1569]ETM49823.1 hypothetical protein L914_06010 [Phytophthora nicotianae]